MDRRTLPSVLSPCSAKATRSIKIPICIGPKSGCYNDSEKGADALRKILRRLKLFVCFESEYIINKGLHQNFGEIPYLYIVKIDVLTPAPRLSLQPNFPFSMV